MTAVLDPKAGILDILAQQCVLHRRLLRVAEAQREALLAADVDRLAPLSREMEGITADVERLERERLGLVRRMTGTEDGGTVSWSELEPRFGAAGATRLRELRAEMLELLQRVRTTNDNNAALIRRAQSFGERWLRLLHGLIPAATYEAHGSVQPRRTVRRAWVA
jgi:flagellar biosynthesis/type III secretory pathway chaperone